MKILRRGGIAVMLFFAVVLIDHRVQAHAFDYHSLQEIEQHIIQHVQELDLLTGQKPHDDRKIAHVRHEILEHLQEYQELVMSEVPAASMNLKQNLELLEQTALNHDYPGTRAVLDRVDSVFIKPVLAP